MKKIITFLITVCLLMSNVCYLGVYAEESNPNVTLTYVDNIETDSQIIIKATLDGGSDYCGFSFGILYDNTKLKPSSANVNSLFASSIRPNLNKAGNQVYFSYTSADPVSNNGEVVSFVFDVLDSATGKINFEIVNAKMYDENYSSVSVDVIGTSGKLPELALPTLTLSTDKNISSEDEFVLSATLTNAANYCGISFGIIYDNTKFTPVSAQVGTDFISTVRPNLNKAENQVYFSYTGADMVSNNGKVVDFTFKVKDDAVGDAEFSITNFKMYDENYLSIENVCIGTKTTISRVRKPVVTNSKVESNVVNVTLSNAEIGDCVIVALYSGERMTFVDFSTYNGEQSLNFPFNAEYDKIKIMVWENLITLKPLGVAEELFK